METETHGNPICTLHSVMKDVRREFDAVDTPRGNTHPTIAQMKLQTTFFPRQVVEAGGNRWDWELLPLVFSLLIVMAYGARQMATPY
jgi:hypothetical protein